MAKTSNSRPFGSSVSRTLGSPFSGYRGNGTVYPDETWKLSLRKYPHNPSPLRRCRSASPKRRLPSGKLAAKQDALQRIMAKMDSTQGDLQALAQKVALWSKEAASLTEGLREETLLLELSRQADKLAGREAQLRELQKHESVRRLSHENFKLRDELRDLIRICKLLLDRTEYGVVLRPTLNLNGQRVPATTPTATTTTTAAAPAVTLAVAPAAIAPSAGSTTANPSRHVRIIPPAWTPVTPPPQPQTRFMGAAITAAVDMGSTTTRAPRANAYDRPSSYAPYGSSEHSHSQQPQTARRQHQECVSDSYKREAFAYGSRQPSVRHKEEDPDPGLEGLTAANAEAVLDAIRAQADVDADPHVPAAAATANTIPPPSVVAAVPLQRLRHGGCPSGPDTELAREQREVGAALAALDDALMRLNLESPAAGGSSGSADEGQQRSAPVSSLPSPQPQPQPPGQPASATAWSGSDPDASSTSFEGFRPLERPLDATPATPAIPEGWRRKERLAQQAPQQLQPLQQNWRQDMTREASVPATVAAALAVAPTELGEGEGWREGDRQEDEQREDEQREDEQQEDEQQEEQERKWLEEQEPAIGTPVGTPVKGTDGAPPSSPDTPVYRSMPFEDHNSRSAPPTVRRDPPPPYGYHTGRDGAVATDAAATQPGAQPLDSVLLAEVEKLKRINRTLAATLQSYSRVTERLDGVGVAAATAAAAAGAPAAMRVLFRSRLDADNVAAPLPPAPASLAAATYGTSSSSSVPPPSYSYPQAYSQDTPPSTQQPAAAASDDPAGPSFPRSQTTDVLSEVRRLDSSLDKQLYGIRRQLQALRQEMVADRLTTLAAPAAGDGAPSRATASADRKGPSQSAPPAYSLDDAQQLVRIQEEIAELRRQVQFDRRWYQESLGSMALERSAMFKDLQRRLEGLIATGL